MLEPNLLGTKPISLYTYDSLLEMGYSVECIVSKTVDLSECDITDYIQSRGETSYWASHRYHNMDLFVCAMSLEEVVAHISAMRVKTDEAMAFLEGKCAETEFTVVSEQDAKTTPHYVYISAVVVKKSLRNSTVALKLIRQGYRLLNQYLKDTQQAEGIFAEAYSDEGRRLCELFGMNNISANFYRKDI